MPARRPGGGLSVRVLVAALAVQVLLGGALVVVAVNGFPIVGGGGDSGRSERHRVALPAVPRATVDRFDAARAWRELLYQVRLGPRPAGSPVLRRLARHLERALPAGRQEAVGGGLYNVVGTLPGTLPAIAVAAHYDTKDIDGFVGANDGAGGTAAVVEVARAMRRVRRPRDAPELRFLLFDGEESPRGAQDFYATGDRGSKAYAARHRGELKDLILLDFIANKGLRLPREAGSDPELWRALRAAARRVGVQAVFPASTRGEILDDHTPFTRWGVPAIDLIDFDYPAWHTTADTPDKLSARSLDAAGEAVVELVRTLARR
jgi:glutaminyl-peptide cyclotransferase